MDNDTLIRLQQAQVTQHPVASAINDGADREFCGDSVDGEPITRRSFALGAIAKCLSLCSHKQEGGSEKNGPFQD